MKKPVQSAPVQNEVKKPTIISKGTQIQGHIKAKQDMEINGKVIGNIKVDGNIIIDGGEITGNVTAKSITIIASTIKGNLDSYTQIDAKQDSVIEGDMKAKVIYIDCVCKGKVNAEESVHLLSTAAVTGDVQTSRIKVDDGALLDGQMKMMTAKPQD